ncbi:uncharacterized protein LOC134674804 isoform X2 [Cydia fagiglandana]|uniref:uncharacterized protein LOC134674804 isoform X2 n=1 Tax=Cydia fagiglandana TaxID=1458189 RepID=UPI002FEE06DF
MFYFITSLIISCGFLFLDSAGQNILIRPPMPRCRESRYERKRAHTRGRPGYGDYAWKSGRPLSVKSVIFLFIYTQGSGTWSVVSTQPCQNDAEMPLRVRLRRHKLNRTHDGFDLEVRADVCKMVEGGCKPFMEESRDCLPCLARERGWESTRSVLVALGIDPPDFPIPKFHYWIAMSSQDLNLSIKNDTERQFKQKKYRFRRENGEYKLDNYVVDAEGLAKKGLYSEFQGTGYIVKHGQDIACYQMSVKFEPIDEFGSVSSLYG